MKRTPGARGSQDAGITQPRDHSLADPCISRSYAAATLSFPLENKLVGTWHAAWHPTKIRYENLKRIASCTLARYGNGAAENRPRIRLGFPLGLASYKRELLQCIRGRQSSARTVPRI